MAILSDHEEFINNEFISGTGEVLRDVSSTGKVRRWEKKKGDSLKVTDLFSMAREVYPDIITENNFNNLMNCGSILKFAEVNGQRKLKEANFCRVRLCPMCNWRRSLKMFAQVSQITDLILKEKPEVRFIFASFTVKNVKGEELVQTLDKMNYAFKLLVNKSFKFPIADKLKENLLGYLKATEVTYNTRTNEYHPHYHCIFEVKPSYFAGRDYMKQTEWSELWGKAMKLDYVPIVDVRIIKGGTAKAVAEVAKYPVKSADLLKIKDKRQAVEALIIFVRSMHGRRLVTFGGEFKTIKRRLRLDDIENGDLVNTTGEKISLNGSAIILFRYCADVGLYVC